MTINSRIPDHVWKRNLNAENPSPSIHTFSRPPILEALSLLPVAYRVGSYIHEERRNGREPIFDLSGITLEPPTPGPHAGVPCGGLVRRTFFTEHHLHSYSDFLLTEIEIQIGGIKLTIIHKESYIKTFLEQNYLRNLVCIPSLLYRFLRLFLYCSVFYLHYITLPLHLFSFSLSTYS